MIRYVINVVTVLCARLVNTYMRAIHIKAVSLNKMAAGGRVGGSNLAVADIVVIILYFVVVLFIGLWVRVDSLLLMCLLGVIVF